jgi:aprataxin
VIELLREDGRVPFDDWRAEAKELLAADLRCHKCDYKPKNMPDLKKHILVHVK